MKRISSKFLNSIICSRFNGYNLSRISTPINDTKLMLNNYIKNKYLIIVI